MQNTSQPGNLGLGQALLFGVGVYMRDVEG